MIAGAAHASVTVIADPWARPVIMGEVGAEGNRERAGGTGAAPGYQRPCRGRG